MDESLTHQYIKEVSSAWSNLIHPSGNELFYKEINE